MDSFLDSYRIRIKSHKWHITLFYHIIDTAVINWWVFYMKNNSNLTSYDCRSELSDTLCPYKEYDGNKKERPSNLEREAKNTNVPQGLYTDGW